jgi:exonuclease VII small subunit
MTLEELLPENPTFHIASKKKSYELRLPNLSDRARFSEWLGDEKKSREVFEKLQWDVIAKLVFRLLIDKSDFMAEDKHIIDDDGVKIKILLTGPAKLMESLASLDEGLKMVEALTLAIRRAEPLVDKMLEAEEKKSLEAKSPLSNGMKSTKESQATMDTQSSNLPN